MATRRKHKRVRIVEKKLGRQKAWGLCYRGENLIELDTRMKARHYLTVLIHELLHHIFPELSETAVTRSAPKIAQGVWSRGFRRIAK